MKASILVMLILIGTIVSIASGFEMVTTNGVTRVTNEDLAAITEHKPSNGYVGDAKAALAIGKYVLRQLLDPEEFQRKVCADATLKDGIWTVQYWEPAFRINFTIVILIRQQTGTIMRYEDPNAGRNR